MTDHSSRPMTCDDGLADVPTASISEDGELSVRSPKKGTTKIIELSEDTIVSYKKKRGPAKRRRRFEIDITRFWQEVWPTKFAWAEGEMVEGVLAGVKCRVCSTINGWPKFIVPSSITWRNMRARGRPWSICYIAG